jgi:hypothetical protein
MTMGIQCELILNWFVEVFVSVGLRTKDTETYNTNVVKLVISESSQEILQL